jgi:hypothetical protein
MKLEYFTEDGEIEKGYPLRAFREQVDALSRAYGRAMTQQMYTPPLGIQSAHAIMNLPGGMVVYDPGDKDETWLLRRERGNLSREYCIHSSFQAKKYVLLQICRY